SSDHHGEHRGSHLARLPRGREPVSGAPTRGRWRRVLVLAAVLATIVAASRTGLFQLHDVARLRAVVERVRATPALPLVFVAAYVMLSAVGVPASALTLAGGALFGSTRGIALNWLGAFGGAMLAFGVVRAMSLHAITQRLHAEGTAAKLLGPGAPMLLF